MFDVETKIFVLFCIRIDFFSNQGLITWHIYYLRKERSHVLNTFQGLHMARRGIFYSFFLVQNTTNHCFVIDSNNCDVCYNGGHAVLTFFKNIVKCLQECWQDLVKISKVEVGGKHLKYQMSFI